jgi:type II secretion system protein N
MKKFRTWIAYGIYVLLVATLFIYFLFPADKVKAHIAAQVGHMYPNLRMSIGDASPIFPPGIRLYKVKLDHVADLMLEAEIITIFPDLRSLFGSSTAIKFTVITQEGIIDGRAEFTGDMPDRRLKMDADITGVQLGEFPFLKSLADYRLKGVISGQVSYNDRQDNGQSAKVQIVITDMQLSLEKSLLGFEDMKFDRVDAEALLNNQQLTISRLKLTGDLLDGDLSGTGIIAGRLKESSISLKGEIKPHQQIQPGLDGEISGKSILGFVSGKGRFPVTVSGPLDNLQLGLQ